jgi:hypothetical protein
MLKEQYIYIYRLFVRSMKIIIKFVNMYLIEVKQITEVFYNGNG